MILSLLKKALARCRFDAIQLHFDISRVPSLPQSIREINTGIKIIGVVSMNSAESDVGPHVLAATYSKTCDAVLLDSTWRGGSGKPHDWRLAAEICKNITIPVILAGGINATNLKDALRIVHPYAIDIESGADRKIRIKGREVGVKSLLKVQQILSTMHGENKNFSID